MDRNTIIGLVLIAGIVLTYTIFFNPEPPKPKDPQQTEQVTDDSTQQEVGSPAPVTDGNPAVQPVDTENFRPQGMSDSAWAATPDSMRAALMGEEKIAQHGPWYRLYEGEDDLITVETDELKLDIHTKGGYISSLYLKKYLTYDSLILPIQKADPSNKMVLTFEQVGGAQFPIVETQDLFFDANGTKDISISGDQTKELVLSAKLDNGASLEYVYRFKGTGYDYEFEIRQTGLNKLIRKSAMQMKWTSTIPKTEKAMSLMRQKTAIYYRESQSVEWVGPTENNEEVQPEAHVDWFSFHSQFFTHTMMSKTEAEPIKNLKLIQGNPVGPDPMDENSGDKVKFMSAELDLPDLAKAEEGSRVFTMYAGPLDFDGLSAYERDMMYQIELGYGPLKWVNRFMIIPLFNWMQGFIGSYGLIIFLLALFIKMLIYPLTYKTYISTAKMRVVNQTPEIKALEEKHKDDPTKLQQEKLGIYRQLGVSMFGGCWPMLLQYPFLIALFFFFPNSIELRQESFLWAEDLSTYDSVMELGFNIPMYGDHVSLFTLLMTISVFAYTFINQKMQGTVATNPVMKYFPYIMPLIILGFLNSYSSGLSWYYLVSNLISITQTMVTKRFIDEDKLLAQMRQNAKKKKGKGSKGKGRLERWADRQKQKQAGIAEQKAASNGGQNSAPKSRGSNHTKKKKRK